MAEYEIEWTEHRKMRARIQAPPNDERMLDAAQEIINVAGIPMPRLIAWAHADNKITAKQNADGQADYTYDITLVGRVEWRDAGSKKGQPAMMEEWVKPL